jgi:1-acyl-sn-glycerol-3-phosphate acyltransferase
MKSPLHVRSFVRSFISYPLWVLLILFVAPVLLVMALLPAPQRYTNRWYFRICSWSCRLLLAIAGVRVVIEGDCSGLSQPSVAVMNHASSLDIIIMESVLSQHLRFWICKHEYDVVPFFSFLLNRMYMLVNAGNSHAAARSLIATKKIVEKTGSHVCIFPEGARFSDGKIHRFYSGFAVLARRLKRPVVPFYIAHAEKALSKDSFLIKTNYSIHVVAGPSFTFEKEETDAQFVARVKAWFLSQQDRFLEE